MTTRKTLQTHQVTNTTVEQTELETTMAELGTMGVHQTLKTTRAKLKQKAQKVLFMASLAMTGRSEGSESSSVAVAGQTESLRTVSVEDREFRDSLCDRIRADMELRSERRHLGRSCREDNRLTREQDTRGDELKGTNETTGLQRDYKTMSGN